LPATRITIITTLDYIHLIKLASVPTNLFVCILTALLMHDTAQ